LILDTYLTPPRREVEGLIERQVRLHGTTYQPGTRLPSFHRLPKVPLRVVNPALARCMRKRKVRCSRLPFLITRTANKGSGTGLFGAAELTD